MLITTLREYQDAAYRESGGKMYIGTDEDLSLATVFRAGAVAMTHTEMEKQGKTDDEYRAGINEALGNMFAYLADMAELRRERDPRMDGLPLTTGALGDTYNHLKPLTTIDLCFRLISTVTQFAGGQIPPVEYSATMWFLVCVISRLAELNGMLLSEIIGQQLTALKMANTEPIAKEQ